MDEKREALAEYAHEAWSGWMLYLFAKSQANDDGTVTIPAWAVERWSRQMDTEYDRLPEQEKESDRAEADKMLALIAPEDERLRDALAQFVDDDRCAYDYHGYCQTHGLSKPCRVAEARFLLDPETVKR
jgi:hypothetical protein